MSFLDRFVQEHKPNEALASEEDRAKLEELRSKQREASALAGQTAVKKMKAEKSTRLDPFMSQELHSGNVPVVKAETFDDVAKSAVPIEETPVEHLVPHSVTVEDQSHEERALVSHS